MKKIFISFAFLLMASMVFAVPAKRGVWRMLRLADGTEVKAQLFGDENFHYFISEDGQRYVADGTKGNYVSVDEKQLGRLSTTRKSKSAAVVKAQRKRVFGNVDKEIFQGSQRGLIILVEFDDKQFQPGNDQSFWNRVANEEGYSDENGFRGSMRDYFHSQSYGQFTLDFDVVGPVKMPNAYAYYGGNDKDGEDLHPGEMVAMACQMVDDNVDFSKYDWNGDGTVDQVYVLYAGEGEHESMDSKTIWPHAWTLEESDYHQTLTLDGVYINSYACSNEVKSDGSYEGIGTMCHEFSHCMGFPDMYDILYSGNYGMGNWDLMCDGSYSGNGFSPVGYTAYERMQCGWNEPIELIGDTIVTDMKPIDDGGNTFIIYNKGHRDEYFLLEYKEKKGWNEFIPAEGMLIMHVDFDPTLWAYNVVNTTGDFSSVYPGIKNDHQRLTIIHADNDDDSAYFSEMMHTFLKRTEDGDTYPYKRNDSLTNRSQPAAKLYNKNLNGRKLMNVAISGIKKNGDGTMSFDFTDFSTNVRPAETGELFYESFDECDGVGGNDGIFSGGNAGVGMFMPDNEDWFGKAMFGGNKCAKSGTNTKSGDMTTPEFRVSGTADFSFLAAPYGNDAEELTLRIAGTAQISPTSFTLTKDKWTECNATITGDGIITVTISPAKRMFIDEVRAFDPNAALGISQHSDDIKKETLKGVYTLQGVRVMGADAYKNNPNSLSKGIYIINGRKVIIK